MNPCHTLLELRDLSIGFWARSEQLNSKATSRWSRRPRVLETVFSHFSFTMNPGEIVVVLGASGTGKSTLLYAIAGFYRPFAPRVGVVDQLRHGIDRSPRCVLFSGQVFMNDEDVTLVEPRERSTGLVMQRYTLYEHMSVQANLEFPLKSLRKSKAEIQEEVGRVVDLLRLNRNLMERKATPENLAGGQMQRVAIAKMLLRKPKLALFDEAFANLDLKLREELRETVVKGFVEENREERGAIFVSHNIESARGANRIIFIPTKNANGQAAEPRVFTSETQPAWEAFCSCEDDEEIRELVRTVRKVGQHWTGVDLNAFRHIRYSPVEVLSDAKLGVVLKPTVLRILTELGVPALDGNAFIDKLWAGFATTSMCQFETETRHLLQTTIEKRALRNALDRRAETIARQIAPHLQGNTLADIGCGDGMVGLRVSTQMQRTFLIDVMNYVDPRASHLPFFSYTDGSEMPISENAHVDTSLLLTVLHHADDPIGLLRRTRQVTRRRTIVIESVYGVEKGAESLPSPLYDLCEEQQRKYATFVDWLYNRVFHDGVPVPYNYNTPKRWAEIFEMTGWRVAESVDLGIDQSIVPEHHWLFVLDVA